MLYSYRSTDVVLLFWPPDALCYGQLQQIPYEDELVFIMRSVILIGRKDQGKIPRVLRHQLSLSNFKGMIYSVTDWHTNSADPCRKRTVLC